jgi:uncharacterized membrane protein
MSKARLEAFSDGVIAIIITIMVLELKVPHGSDFAVLRDLLPTFMSYVLSFVFVGIYWSNHHHMLMAARKITGGVLWANLHLLFWLSLTPFATAWMGENNFQAWPVAFYGVVLWTSSIAYWLLAKTLIAVDDNRELSEAIGSDFKGRISTLIYTIAIPLAFFHVGLSLACYVGVALMWLVPDRRIERRMQPK